MSKAKKKKKPPSKTVDEYREEMVTVFPGLELDHENAKRWLEMSAIERTALLNRWQTQLLKKYREVEKALYETIIPKINQIKVQLEEVRRGPPPPCWADCPGYHAFAQQVSEARRASRRAEGAALDAVAEMKKVFKELTTIRGMFRSAATRLLNLAQKGTP